MKKIHSLYILLLLSYCSYSQVAINTTGASPNTSAMLDVSSSNKGLLVPRVALLSKGDNTTIPSAATSLLVWNTNVNMPKGAGYYYNSGTPLVPSWQPITELILPYYQATSESGPALQIDNYKNFYASSAIKGYNGGTGRGLEGSSLNGVGVYAHSTNGTALEVDGKLNIQKFTARQGKVLTTDDDGNATWQGAIAFSAQGVVYANSGYAPQSTVKVKFATEAYDLGGAYANSIATEHSTFTAPYKGIYHFDVQIKWQSDPNYDMAGSFLYLKGKYNGVTDTLTHSELNMTDEYFGDHRIGIDLMLEAGTQVWVEVKQTAKVQINLDYNPGSTYFNGHMVVRL